jgi:hypothetical protein
MTVTVGAVRSGSTSTGICGTCSPPQTKSAAVSSTTKKRFSMDHLRI